ncbi:putative protein archease [Streptomyces mashuensis]|uniref:Archease domain-containing protein n=1 Tax=Streptomyces mashuensis TaxID=33904 RepID=A0A919B561_9ACTN|nr:archease [Streptomyces mashuensis]GHF58527.1 putative protein archease [Streptomyces mashuensis]
MDRPGDAPEPRAGHRSVPHTADLRVEAWAPTREECLAQAVRGVCTAFLDLTGATPVRTRDHVVRAASDDDLLVALLDEVVYRLDTDGEVPVDTGLTAVPGGLHATFRMADAASLPTIGAAPKAVTLHGLECGPTPGGWACAVTLDV